MQKIFYLIFGILFLVSPALVQAAEISVVPAGEKSFVAGEKFQVDVVLDTAGESLNAFLGTISFPENLLSLSEVRDGNSIVNFWIERPKISPLSFSGITPGGYVGSHGLLLSLVFTAQKSGAGVISVDNAETLRNDGKGTSVKVSAKDFAFSVKTASGAVPVFQSAEDKDPPENFTPTLAKDPNLFDGQWFLVFATSDKGSGIDHYEVSEGKNNWVVAESPYLLKKQNLLSDIFVKAVDKAGNERLAVIHTQPWLGYVMLALLAIIVITAAVFYRKRLVRHRK